MADRVSDVTLILRQWSTEAGLVEHEHVYPSLDALYSACLHVHDPNLIDRIVISGFDAQNVKRDVTFVFQSITARLIP